MTKKMFFAVVFGLLLVLAFSTVVMADNGPHGGFSGSTDACANCHRAHSANSADGMLLKDATEYALCISCHGGGTGAQTDVVNGYYHAGALVEGDTDMGLFAGGFDVARMLTNYGVDFDVVTGVYPAGSTNWAAKNAYDPNATAPIGAAVTSRHDVDGVVGTIWGSGVYGSAPLTMALECTSCHDPHGNAGRDAAGTAGKAVPSYRLLRFTPHDGATVPGYEIVAEAGSGTAFNWNYAALKVATTEGVWVEDPAVKWYTINSDIVLDGTLAMYRGRTGSGEIYTAISAGLGDYGARYWSYRRPSQAVTTTGTTRYLCPDPATGNPDAVTGVCGPTVGAAFDNVVAHDDLGYWCSTCHDRYLARGGGTRTTDTGDPAYHYRHRSQGNGTTAGQYTCVDCHNAHGTSAASTVLASAASLAGDGAILKADNRAICLRCHAGAVNSFNITVSPNAIMVLP